ncbi:hypothetical protein [Streptomyces rochei]|uniref:hypothetical protein n=1 Tax=Streptomyces rochei TaxID=1928 RepID=UPI0022E9AD57|nr:hypothetical protein [Streptomyces rochei]MCC8452756.1 hypothetical protein [Streptomyces rochei]
MARVADLTRHHWQGRWHPEGGYHSYDRCIPIVATTLEELRAHGPAGPAFWRFGRDHRQPIRKTSDKEYRLTVPGEDIGMYEYWLQKLKEPVRDAAVYQRMRDQLVAAMR